MNNLEDIVEIKCNDFDLVLDIIFESKLIEDKFLDLSTAVVFIKNKMLHNRAKIFVKKQKDNVVAFILLYYKANSISSKNYSWHISYLYVKPDFRRRYIGRQILEKCIDYSLKSKAHHLSLNTDCDNYASHKLYESLGFKRMNFIANYYYYELQIAQ